MAYLADTNVVLRRILANDPLYTVVRAAVDRLLLRGETIYPNFARITVPVSTSNQPSKEPPGCTSLGHRLVGRRAWIPAAVAGSREKASNRMSAVLLGCSCSRVR